MRVFILRCFLGCKGSENSIFSTCLCDLAEFDASFSVYHGSKNVIRRRLLGRDRKRELILRSSLQSVVSHTVRLFYRSHNLGNAAECC